ncbi:LOW QUALITY PROTEIN: heme transporter IsdDEF, permease component IsdF [Bacillus sp. JCM 19046]|nr:LOW QUALITY PROTEIN: heme transporter IsdDEF, permease component IsdF [Bacillus sp. JCM 19046]
MKKGFVFFVLTVLFLVVLYWATMSGSIAVSFSQLVEGVRTGLDEEVNVIYDLRFPRIIVATIAGAALALAGALIQAVMRNPIADPGIIGISSGAQFVAILFVTIFPQLYFYMPLFAFVGGMTAFLLVYSFAYKGGLSPLKLILIGVAVHATFSVLTEVFQYRGSYSVTSISTVTSSTLSMKTWTDANAMMLFGGIAILLALLLARACNVLQLSEKTASSLGMRITFVRMVVSVVAVVLASVATALAGIVFLGLLIPHIGRQLVGNDYRVLLPFSALGGAFLLLLADTLGRLMIAPNELPASILMSVIGGPFLIFLLRRSKFANGTS